MSRAQKVIQFIETLRCPDGSMVGRPFKLREWQKRWIRKVYKTRGSKRLVRQAVLSMPRKNGKTALIAALCLVHLCGPEAIQNGQLYSVSYEREQAAIVFKYLSAMVYMDEELSDRLGVIESRKMVVDRENGSTYTALSSESKSKHGKSASFVVFDELAQFGADRQLYDVMLTSSGAHDEPLFFVISTQAASDNAVLSELIDYGLANPDEQTFTVDLFHADHDADIWDEKVWHQANPALGDFRSIDEMRDFAVKAKSITSAEAAFRNLYLNQRIEATGSWISRDAWERCKGEPTAWGRRYGGLDLSAKNDLTALAWIEEDAESVSAFLRCWTPEQGLPDRSRRDKAPYDVWVRSGQLLATPGPVIDYAYIAAEIARLHVERPFAAIAFDRWRIDDLRRHLEDQGCEVELVPHGQGFKDMGPAVEGLEDLILSSRLRHGGHPLFNMACANAKVTQDPAGAKKFDKKKTLGRIDPIVALAMAATCWKQKRTEEEEVSVYENRGIRTL